MQLAGAVSGRIGSVQMTRSGLVLVSRCVKAWMRIQSETSANVLELCDGRVACPSKASSERREKTESLFLADRDILPSRAG